MTSTTLATGTATRRFCTRVSLVKIKLVVLYFIKHARFFEIGNFSGSVVIV